MGVIQGFTMNNALDPVKSPQIDIFDKKIKLTPAQRQHAQKQNSDMGQRRYEVMYLDAQGNFSSYQTIASAHPAFEAAFAVFGHAAIVQTQNGHLSVEDVMPGDEVRVSGGTYEKLLWRGRITLGPSKYKPNATPPTMTRITSDAFGTQRPSQDLVLGPSANLLHRASGISKITGSDAAYIAAAEFVDDNTVLNLTPATPVSVFQFGFAGQRSLMVNGLEVETLHPGSPFNLGLRGEELREYLSLFPHKKGLEDFGIMAHPRLRMRDLDLLR